MPSWFLRALPMKLDPCSCVSTSTLVKANASSFFIDQSNLNKLLEFEDEIQLRYNTDHSLVRKIAPTFEHEMVIQLVFCAYCRCETSLPASLNEVNIEIEISRIGHAGFIHAQKYAIACRLIAIASVQREEL